MLFLFESCRDCILSFLVVSSARTHPSLPWEFLLMRLSCNCSLRQSWKDVLFWPKDFKLSQPRRPNASSATGQGHNARVFFCAGQPWMTDFNRSNVLGVWTLHPLHLRSMTIQLEKAFDMTRHAALNTSFVGLEQNDRMNWHELTRSRKREGKWQPTGLF